MSDQGTSAMRSPPQPLVLRSTREINLMRRAGLVVWQAHQAAYRILQPGVTTADLDREIAQVFAQAQATPAFLNYRGGSKVPFPAVACVSVNEEIVHGIPGPRQLNPGDIVSIDTGCRLSGWYGDAAITYAVGAIDEASQKLLEITHGALDVAIEQAASARLWSEVAKAISDYVHAAGLTLVEDMVGHGIGREMHEPPNVPNHYDPKWAKKHDFQLRPGLVLAIEPMVCQGRNKIRCLEDHWTLVTTDGKRSAHFEHTVAITQNGPRRLTGPPSDTELDLVAPQFRDPELWVRW